MSNLEGISKVDLSKLRSVGLITDDEIAYVYRGSTLLIENLKTSARRLLDASSVEIAATKQILKGY